MLLCHLLATMRRPRMSFLAMRFCLLTVGISPAHFFGFCENSQSMSGMCSAKAQASASTPYSMFRS